VIDEMTYVRNINGYSILVCEKCLDNYSYCEDCDTYFHHSDGYHCDDGFHCTDCYDKFYRSCAVCGNIEHKSDMTKIDENYYCDV
jgi:hypothetical protein